MRDSGIRAVGLKYAGRQTEPSINAPRLGVEVVEAANSR